MLHACNNEYAIIHHGNKVKKDFKKNLRSTYLLFIKRFI